MTSGFDPAAYSEMPGRQAQLDGYLSGTTAAVLTCARTTADWARQPEPWPALLELVTRYESEFTGRLLIARADVERWNSEPPDSLCWGVLAVAGLDHVLNESSDVERLSLLLERGVRVFQLVASAGSRMGGSDAPGDHRGLTEMGRTVVTRLAELASLAGSGPRPIVDLARMSSRAAAETLAALEEPSGAGRLLPVCSYGTIAGPWYVRPSPLNQDNLVRLRSLGGVIGLTPAAPYHQTTNDFRAAIETAAAVPFQGRPGWEGIAIATDFLGVDSTVPGLNNVGEIKKWLLASFGPEPAETLAADNARRLLLRAAGVSEERSPMRA
jgi:membrane dipeptidase